MPNEQSGSAKGKTETNSQEGCPNSPAADKKDKKNYKQKTNDAKGRLASDFSQNIAYPE